MKLKAGRTELWCLPTYALLTRLQRKPDKFGTVEGNREGNAREGLEVAGTFYFFLHMAGDYRRVQFCGPIEGFHFLVAWGLLFVCSCFAIAQGILGQTADSATSCWGFKKRPLWTSVFSSTK